MSIIENYFLEMNGFRQQLSRLEIADQGITLLFGASGSGKSSFLRALMGLERRARLNWKWSSSDPNDMLDIAGLRPAQRKLGVVFQDSWVFPHLKVRQVLDLARKNSTLELPAFVQEQRALVEELGISSILERKSLHLSGGERQRVAFALALLVRPRLLLLDEPFASLDEPNREVARALLKQVLSQRNIGAILVSHDVRDRIPWADHEILFPLPEHL